MNANPSAPASRKTPAAAPSTWRVFLTRAFAFIEAMEMSPQELDDRRLEALEAEVTRLRTVLERQQASSAPMPAQVEPRPTLGPFLVE